MWPCKWCPFMPTSPSSPDLLERCPFLALTLPWGPLCSLGLAQRNVSDDGPILWVRPGEQMIPTGELGPTPKKKRNTYVLIVSGGGGGGGGLLPNVLLTKNGSRRPHVCRVLSSHTCVHTHTWYLRTCMPYARACK